MITENKTNFARKFSRLSDILSMDVKTRERDMRHFAFTHSLTLAEGDGVPAKLVLFLNKRGGVARPCHWWRAGNAGFPEAIALGEAVLSEGINVAIVIAQAKLADGAIAATLAGTLAAAGLADCELLARPEAPALRGAA